MSHLIEFEPVTFVLGGRRWYSNYKKMLIFSQIIWRNKSAIIVLLFQVWVKCLWKLDGGL